MSSISRSAHQKVVEENKKLMADIRILTSYPTAEKIICIAKWQRKFQEEERFHHLLRVAANEYIKEHKDELPDFLTKNI